MRVGRGLARLRAACQSRLADICVGLAHWHLRRAADLLVDRLRDNRPIAPHERVRMHAIIWHIHGSSSLAKPVRLNMYDIHVPPAPDRARLRVLRSTHASGTTLVRVELLPPSCARCVNFNRPGRANTSVGCARAVAVGLSPLKIRFVGNDTRALTRAARASVLVAGYVRNRACPSAHPTTRSLACVCRAAYC